MSKTDYSGAEQQVPPSERRYRDGQANAVNQTPTPIHPPTETVGDKKIILDACCGGRMFWFDKHNPNALYVDNRVMERQLIWKGNGKREGQEVYFEVKPDMVMDFRNLDLPDNQFSLVVFDPPHIIENCKSGYQKKKYGSLSPKTWRDDLRSGFAECFRVLKPNGVLIFKWNEIDFPVSEVLKLTPIRPLFGHKSGKQQKTHWICFMKGVL